MFVILILAMVALVLWMGWTTSYESNKPVGTDSPANLDTIIMTGAKEAMRERLAIDHDFAIVGNKCDGTDIGKHKKITFKDPLTAQTPGADEGILYTKTVATVSELHFADENAAEKQITSGGQLNVVIADLAPGTSGLCDDDTIEVDAAAGIQLKAAASGTGVLKGHLSPDAGDLCDDSTIEIDATNGLQIKTPAAGADVDAIGAPVMACGRYTGGDGADVTIETGITIRSLTIIRVGDESAPAFAVVDGTGMSQITGNQNAAGLTLPSATSFTAATANAFTNWNNGYSYSWVAYGTRP